MKKALVVLSMMFYDYVIFTRNQTFLKSVAGEGKVKVVPDQNYFCYSRNKGNNAKDVKKAK
jgi:hypothetical protein